MFNIFAHAGETLDDVVQVSTVAPAPIVDINWWAILLATAAAMVIGSIWYGPLFGDKWLKLMRRKKSDLGGSWTPMLSMLALAFVQVLVLTHFISYSEYFYPDINNLNIGLLTGFWAWIGFIVPAVTSLTLFGKRPKELLKLDLGNHLVTLLAIGAILAVF